MGVGKAFNPQNNPHTNEYIESVVESHEAFLIRRINRAAQQFANEGIVPASSQLYKRANITKYVWEHRIGDRVDEVLSIIPKMISESNVYLKEAAVTKELS